MRVQMTTHLLCLTLLEEGSPLVSSYGSSSAVPRRLLVELLSLHLVFVLWIVLVARSGSGSGETCC